MPGNFENSRKKAGETLLFAYHFADALVFANGYHVDSAMEDMLKAAGAAYHLIGDGAKVGNIKDAISGPCFPVRHFMRRSQIVTIFSAGKKEKHPIS
jgi:hypothetical protein